MNQRQNRVLWGSLFSASLVFSLLVFLLFVPSLKHVVLFFPTAGFVRLESEVHSIPRDVNLSVEIKRTVESLLSGPLSLKFKRVAPLSTYVRSCYVVNSSAYIDLDGNLQASDSETPLTVSDRLTLIKRSILQNYPAITNVIVLIQGQEVYSLPYQAGRKS